MKQNAPTPTGLDVYKIRQDFPIFSRKLKNGKPVAYLDSAATSQRPRQVVEAMEKYFFECNANIHRGVYQISEEATAAYESARQKVAKFINAQSSREIIFTRNATEAINLVAYTWGRQNISQGDLIVLTIMEHHSNIVPWQILAKEKGARIEYVDIDEKGYLRLDQYTNLLQQAPKLVSFTHVSNVLGTINPVKQMVKQAKEAGATVLVDAAQSAPHMAVDVQDIGCDFLAISGHKMLGPTGIGCLYGKRELLEQMPPFLGGGDMILKVTLNGASWNELPWKYEAGTPAIAEAIGLGAAIDYLNRIGMENIHAHEKMITEYALEALSEIDNLTIYGPPLSDRSGVISVTIPGVHPHDLATIVDRDGIALRAGHHCCMPLMDRLDIAATARISFYMYTIPEEIDRFVESLKKAKEIFEK